jgi:CRISPR/Cas system-associated exonuclease Cas4 (RecB family)
VADWTASNLEPVVFSEKDSRESLAEKGRAMLERYVAESNGSRPRLVEERFEIPLFDPETGEVFDISLRGVIDLVEEDGTLVELKTAARTLDVGSLERHLQLSTYALVVFAREGRIPKLRVDMLLKTKTPRLERRETARTIEDLGWTAQLIASASAAILRGVFLPNPSWRCAECEYFGNCQRWRG